MPNPNDSALEDQKKQLGQQIDAKKQELANAPDDQKAGIQQQIDDLERQRRDLQPQRQAAREENRAEDRAERDAQKDQRQQGKGRSTAPGQQRDKG